MTHTKTLKETRLFWHSRIVALGLSKDEFTLMAGLSSSVWYAGDIKLSTANKIEDKLCELEAIYRAENPSKRWTMGEVENE